jgi:hypothetical protein
MGISPLRVEMTGEAMIEPLLKDTLFGILSFLLVILSLGLGCLVVWMVSKPADDFTRGIISALVRVAPVLKRPADPDFEKTRLLIGLIGAILSFVAGISPLIFYDIRLYLLFLGMGMFFGVLGLASYGLWIYLLRR